MHILYFVGGVVVGVVVVGYCVRSAVNEAIGRGLGW